MLSNALGLLAAQAMEQLAERYGDDASLRTAALVVEIDLGEEGSDLLVTATDERPWVQIAFLQEGILALEEQLEACRNQDES